MLIHLGPNPTSDVIVTKNIGGQLKILLIRRSRDSSAEPGKLALPGGFVDSFSPSGGIWHGGAETYLEAARRELHEETGLDLNHISAERFQLVGVYDDPGRDPRNTNEAWTESHVFSIQLDNDETDEVIGSDDAEEAGWYSQDEIRSIGAEGVAFDHFLILKENGFI